MNRRILLSITAIASALTVSSCSAINVNMFPQPGNDYSDGYDIILEFENVLNLPDRAKVVMAGTEVGTVTKVAVESSQVDVTAQIDPSVAVPANARAALEQATILGDIYVTLDPPDNEPAAPPLQPGAKIALAQTTSPPQLEDTLAHLADFVGSGSIQRLQNTVIEINRITPPQPELRDLASRVTTDLRVVSDNIDSVDYLLNGASQTASILNERRASIDFWFSPRGMRGFDRGFQVTAYLGRLFPSVGTVYTGGYWLTPMLKSLVESMNALRRSKWAFEDEGPAWQRLFNDLFLPQDKYPAINITSITGPDGRELSGNVHDVLRILGAAP